MVQLMVVAVYLLYLSIFETCDHISSRLIMVNLFQNFTRIYFDLLFDVSSFWPEIPGVSNSADVGWNLGLFGEPRQWRGILHLRGAQRFATSPRCDSRFAMVSPWICPRSLLWTMAAVTIPMQPSFGENLRFFKFHCAYFPEHIFCRSWPSLPQIPTKKHMDSGNNFNRLKNMFLWTSMNINDGLGRRLTGIMGGTVWFVATEIWFQNETILNIRSKQKRNRKDRICLGGNACCPSPGLVLQVWPSDLDWSLVHLISSSLVLFFFFHWQSASKVRFFFRLM